LGVFAFGGKLWRLIMNMKIGHFYFVSNGFFNMVDDPYLNLKFEKRDAFSSGLWYNIPKQQSPQPKEATK
jgi:hypothetical protein